MKTKTAAIQTMSAEERDLSIEDSYTIQQLGIMRDTVAKGATPVELAMFLTVAAKKGLDPLEKQIHFVKRNTREGPVVSIQTGIDGYRLIAERTGAYAGSDDYTFNDGKTQYELVMEGAKRPITASATVYRLVGTTRIPFTATCWWDGYVPPQDFMWNKNPFNQLGKCAEALALRRAFPNDLSGIYTDDEMAQADAEIIVEDLDAVDAPEPKPRTRKIGDQLKKQLAEKKAPAKSAAPRNNVDATMDARFQDIPLEGEAPRADDKANVQESSADAAVRQATARATAIATKCSHVGLDTRDDALLVVAAIAGRSEPIASRKELTQEETVAVLKVLTHAASLARAYGAGGKDKLRDLWNGFIVPGLKKVMEPIDADYISQGFEHVTASDGPEMSEEGGPGAERSVEDMFADQGLV